MLGSVLHARDAWLRPGGLLLPSHATLWCAPLSDEERFEDTTAFWDDVYGINRRALAPHALRCAFAEPLVESLPPQALMSWPVPLRRIDIGTIRAEEVLPWEGAFEAASMGRAPCHGLALWFSVDFHNSASLAAAQLLPPPQLGVGAPPRLAAGDAAPRVVLSTGPEDPATHWMTTLLYLDAPLATQQDGRISGSLRMAPHAENARFITLQLTMRADEAAAVEKTFQMT
jgi:protein arginine N-methyltransferase 6